MIFNSVTFSSCKMYAPIAITIDRPMTTTTTKRNILKTTRVSSQFQRGHRLGESSFYKVGTRRNRPIYFRGPRRFVDVHLGDRLRSRIPMCVNRVISRYARHLATVRPCVPSTLALNHVEIIYTCEHITGGNCFNLQRVFSCTVIKESRKSALQLAFR